MGVTSWYQSPGLREIKYEKVVLELKPVCSCDKEPIQSKTRSRSKGRSECKYVFMHVNKETNGLVCAR
ncbi:hypothetical protein HanIR_Chr15g0755451 [Helianthus annuus]|nr:hypothetical protein HanIR_Chr15g0755451 [Helianthus annuus]